MDPPQRSLAMDPPQRTLGLDSPGNLVFTVVKPMVGLLQVSAAETGPSGSMGLQTQTQDQGLVSHMVQTSPGLVSHMVQTSPGLVPPMVQTSPGLVPPMVQTSPGLVPHMVQTSPGLMPHMVQTSPGLVQHMVQTSPGLVQHMVQTNPGLVTHMVESNPGLVSHMVQSTPGLVSHMVQSTPGLVSHMVQSNPGLVPNMAVQMNPETAEVQDPGPTPDLNQNQDLKLDPAENQNQDLCPDPVQSSVGHLPFAEVASLLDPNMKGSKARKFLISYEEIRRRLLPPEKMSLRSIAAYTRVSRGPVRKRTLQDSLRTLGLTPGTTTAVSSSFSKLTEGDTRSLCEDMKDFSQEYIDYEAVAKRLIPKVNTVQHWSKIIETRNHLEDLRRCFLEPSLSQSFDSVTHGLGLGMVHVVLDLVSSVIQAQVRILSGPENPELTADANANAATMQRKRKLCRRHGNGGQGAAAILKNQRRKKRRQNVRQGEELMAAVPQQHTGGSDVLLLTVGYEAVTSVSGD